MPISQRARKASTSFLSFVVLCCSLFVAPLASALTAQTITGFSPATPVLFSGGTFALSATGGASGNPVVFSSGTTGICTVSGSTVTKVAVGTCTLRANQTGNATYSAAPQVSKNVVINKGTQTITFAAIPGKGFGVAPFTVPVTASSSLGVVLTSTTTTVCTVSGSTVTIVALGTCTIAANQAGNTNYNAATQVTQSFAVAKGVQTITFAALTAKTLGAAPFTTSATASSGLAVAFTSTTAAVCTVAGTTVTLVSAGTCTLSANQAGNTNFNAAAQVSQSFTVSAAAKTNQTITFAAIANTALGTPLTLTGITATSGLTVAMTSATTTICTVSGFAVTLVAQGTCTLRANQTGNASFNAAPQVSRSFTVLAAPVKTNQTITFAAVPNTALGTPLTLTGITATSGLAVLMTSSTTGTCTISGFTVTLSATGTCTLLANQAGNASFNAAPQVSQSFTVLAAASNKLDQTISFNDLRTDLPSQSLNTSPLKFNLVASSGLMPLLTSGTPDVCTVSPSGFNVTLLTTGYCALDANQAGNANYNPAPGVALRFSVLPPNSPAQTLSYGALQVATGSLESCAITELGGVKCWRGNLQAVDIAGLGSGVVALAVGYQSCALMTSSGVKCWSSTRIPVDVFGLTSGVAAIAVGGGHACALMTSGGVKCWGNNASRQLGNNSTIQSNTPVDVIGLTSGVTAISTGSNFTCAVTASGGAKCWGDNTYGQLGDNSLLPRSSVVDVFELTSGVKAIAAGGRHACAIARDGSVLCWGSNEKYQLGNLDLPASSFGRPLPPITSGSLVFLVSIVAGTNHTCGADGLGGVKCWGDGGYGQLGDGGARKFSTPESVNNLTSGVAQISAGGNDSCALTAGGEVKCWGANEAGPYLVELNINGYYNQSRRSPVGVSGLSNSIRAVSAGGAHTCALGIGDDVKCWGNNNNGQLGDGTTTNRQTPVVASPLEIGNSNSISAGGEHTCALSRQFSYANNTTYLLSNSIKCWGANASGQISDGTVTKHSAPGFTVSLLSTQGLMASGGNHTCSAGNLVSSINAIRCSGANAKGQLGDNTTIDKSIAVDVYNFTQPTLALSSGNQHTCSIGNDRLVRCWGANTSGQLGDGTITQRNTPVVVNSITADAIANAIAAGGEHTCVRTDYGIVNCWGRNTEGQLGDGTTMQRNTAITVNTSGTTINAIAAGGSHTCALTNAGGVKCWGLNASGQLGDNTTTQRNSPVDVVGLSSNVVAISAGANHTCAALADGSVKCWGRNTEGQLGDNTLSNRLSPTLVFGSGTRALLASSANPATENQSITYTMTVTGASPTGTVAFKVNGTTIAGCSAVALTNAIATCTTSFPTLDSRHITAIYSGDTLNSRSVSALSSGQRLIPPTFNVTSSVTGQGGILPNGVTAVARGNSGSFTLPGYFDYNTIRIYPAIVDVVSGTCGGTLQLGTYAAASSQFTTNPITADCTVIVSYKPQLTQTIAFNPEPPTSGFVGQTFTLGASASSGLRVKFKADSYSTTKCTITDNVLTLIAPSLCGVIAYQTDDYTFQGAQVTRIVAVLATRPGDLNGDTKSDLLLQATDGTVAAWLMDGTTVVSKANLRGADQNWTVTHVADFNGDGKADILWRNVDGTVALWLMNGTTVLSTATLRTTEPNWTVTHTGDFNGDGKADILWRNIGGTTTVWLMNGTTITQSADLRSAEPNWRVSHVADFDNDGRLDLLWRNIDGSVTRWLMSGVYFTNSTEISGADPNWRVSHVVATTSNGNGLTYILWRHNDGSIKLCRYIYGSCFTTDLSGPDANWRVSHMADFDGDGTPDLLWSHTDGRFKIGFLEPNSTTVTTTDLAGVPANSRVTHTPDLNGDGKADLIWRKDDGTITAWLMDGAISTASAQLAGPNAYRVLPLPEAEFSAPVVLPSVTITSPVNNTTVGSPVMLTVNAQSIPGSIATIEFLDGANQIIGYNINPGATSYLLNYAWDNATSGSHTITAKVVNSAGVTYTSAPITVQVRTAPSVGVAAPGVLFVVPGNVDILASAAAVEPGATLNRIEIYIKDETNPNNPKTLLTTLSTPPYRYRLHYFVGSYSITARAYDSFGSYRDSISLPIKITNNPIQIAPNLPDIFYSGAVYVNSYTFSFRGVANTLPDSSITVNGLPATITRDGAYIINDLALKPGANTLTIVATPPSGPALTQTVTVTRAANPPSFELDVSPIQGVAPVNSLIKVKNPGNSPFTTILSSCDNPTGDIAEADIQSTNITDALQCAYPKPGVYHPWAAIKDAAGNVIWSSSKFAVVRDPLDTIAIVRGVYTNLIDQLTANNKAGALTNFFGHAQTKYDEIFTALGSNVAAAAARLGAISTIVVNEDVAEITVIRTVGTTQRTFAVHLLRGDDGVWRIEDM
jgi:alpha-tubulin suppressor-like RCC1 family protein